MNDFISKIDEKRFYIFTILNIMSSSMVLLEFPELSTFKGWLILIGFTFIISSVLSCLAIYNIIFKKLIDVLCGVLICLVLVELFLWINFKYTINEVVMNIIIGTNVKESREFFLTYFNCRTIIVCLVVFLIFMIVYCLSKRIHLIRSKVICFCIMGVMVFSVVEVVNSVYSYYKYEFGGKISAYSTFLRVLRLVYIYNNTKDDLDLLISTNESQNVTKVNYRCEKMIVIIGESFSKYHSQLYGYEKETNPLLMKKVNNGELFLFTNVITTINDTERAFCAIYSLGDYNKDDYINYALFPVIMRKSGFYTSYIDNMDLASATNRVKDSKKLSDIMYDYRNKRIYNYDSLILDELKNNKSQELYVIKLLGQHYIYKNTFPKSYSKWSYLDYHNNYSDNIKQIIADYDNSTLYNDYVINSIIDKFREENAVVIYFSDHGEEVYDEREYMGHGGTTPYPKYQFDIPFMIWMSDKYKENNPDIVDAILENRDKAYSSNDVSHTILNMAGVVCEQYISERSLASKDFAPRKERIINRSIIYNN